MSRPAPSSSHTTRPSVPSFQQEKHPGPHDAGPAEAGPIDEQEAKKWPDTCVTEEEAEALQADICQNMQGATCTLHVQEINYCPRCHEGETT